MRTVHWLFLVSAMLFLGGIAFIIAAERTRLTAPPPVAAPVVTRSVASVKQVMKGLIAPASTLVYQSVGVVVSVKGTETFQPKNDEEWAALETSGAMLAESGNLLMSKERAMDAADWTTISRALVDAGIETMKAAKAKDFDGMLAVGEKVNTTCDKCHAKYRRD